MPGAAWLLDRIGAAGTQRPVARRRQGFPLGAMAGASHAGDWRHPERIRGWAAEVAMELLSLTGWGGRICLIA